MMHAETKQFLEDLYRPCLPGLPPAFMTFTAIHPDGSRPTPSRHIPPGNDALLQSVVAQLLEANQQGWGAYFGVALRGKRLGRWLRGGRHELACLPALYVDIDHPQNAVTRLGWFDLPASCILHSGRGYHAYWFLETPTTDLVFADRALRGLAAHLEGDRALTVAQSMRLPGTMNTKPGRDNALCTFFSYHPERRYALEEFEPFTRRNNNTFRPVTPRESNGEPDHDIHESVLDEITASVMYRLEGHWRSSGYIGARCPYHHEHDRPGMHFSYNPRTGWGHCFGKHGRFSPADLCGLFSIADPAA